MISKISGSYMGPWDILQPILNHWPRLNPCSKHELYYRLLNELAYNPESFIDDTLLIFLDMVIK